MAEAALVEAGEGSSPSPLLSVSFQKNEQRKFKFLEGEPKALGITQICISVFHMSCTASLIASDRIRSGEEIETTFFISSTLIVVAGGLAIAAKNLHLPTLRACLGMEIAASVFSLFNLIVTLIALSDYNYPCWHYTNDNPQKEICRKSQAAHVHLFTELAVVQVTLFAIAVTLVVYAAKVAHCCVPNPKVPVITIQAPPAPRGEERGCKKSSKLL